MVWLRITGNRLIRTGKLDHGPQNGGSQIWDRNDAKAPAFDPSQYRRMGMGDDPACAQRDSDAVVANEPCEFARLLRCRD